MGNWGKQFKKANLIFELGMFENKIDRIANRSVKRGFSISSEWLKKGPDPSFKNLLA